MNKLLGFLCLLLFSIAVGCGSTDVAPVTEPTVDVDVQIGTWGVYQARDATSWKLATNEQGRLLTFRSQEAAIEGLALFSAANPDITLTVGPVGGVLNEDGTHGCDVCVPPPHYP